jgi:uncharacterized iron-regulated protein
MPINLLIKLKYRKIAIYNPLVMRKSASVLALICAMSSSTLFGQSDQSLQVYQFYTPDGIAVSFENVIETLSLQDVVLFGEHHDHALIHWLQLKIAEKLSDKKPMLMGGEMFETDNQLIIDEYIAGLVNDRRFEAEAKLWPNYKTDYRPLLQLAKSLETKFIATNVPRRYASLVSQSGLDTLNTLSDDAKALMAPLPIEFSMETPGYPEMMEMMHGGGMGMNFDPKNFVKAQAIKDATMADRILKNLKSQSVFLHFNGDYHSADYGGIYWYLKRANPDLKIATIKIANFHQENSDQNAYKGGDFILVVPEDFTKTH